MTAALDESDLDGRLGAGDWSPPSPEERRVRAGWDSIKDSCGTTISLLTRKDKA